jgi:tRNA pseudouridine32 synthase/23S rRNA pseudouridine746 synthase
MFHFGNIRKYDVSGMTLDDLQTRILYRDALMLVLDKPAGIAVHRGPKGGVSLEAGFPALRFGLPRDPALAHRLDRDTAGCLVLGRHHKALEKLGLLFKQGKIGKTYWAVVEGAPPEDEGLIDLPLGRLDATRGWWMKVDPQGQPAQTRWKILARDERQSLLALTPLTGRTHQLRDLWHGRPRGTAASARARDRNSNLQEQGSDQGRGAGGAAHAGRSLGIARRGLRLSRAAAAHAHATMRTGGRARRALPATPVCPSAAL